MSYKLDLRKCVSNHFGKLSTHEILQLFKGRPISRATVFRTIKDCKEGKPPQNAEKTDRPPKLGAKVWTIN